MTPTRDALIERLARQLYASMVTGATAAEATAVERASGLRGTALHEARRLACFAHSLRPHGVSAP